MDMLLMKALTRLLVILVRKGLLSHEDYEEVVSGE